MAGKLGRLPGRPTQPRLKLAAHLYREVPPTPELVDWLSRVSDWPVYGNDAIGDCTCASAAHKIISWSTYAGARQQVTTADVIAAYSAVSGYDPRTGANDNGAVMQDVLGHWRKEGIGGHKILGFAQVDVSDYQEVRAALWVFGGLYLGFWVPQSAFDQFRQGQPWDVVAGSTIRGGHAVNAGITLDVEGDVLDRFQVVTWGRVQAMTRAFWNRYVDEAWAVISPEWLDAVGHNPTGLDLYGLGEELQELTGEPNPFPPPQPDPDVTVVDAADAELAPHAHAWLQSRMWARDRTKLQRPLQQWLDIKGL